MPYIAFDQKTLKVLPIVLRDNKMSLREIKNPDADTIVENNNPEIDVLANRIVEARKKGKPVIWFMGAHVLRRGNSRFIIRLMEEKIITHIATNGAVPIHDFELAFQGATCEDVEFYIKDGKFGNWEETGRYINEAITKGYNEGRGLGESIGVMIHFGHFPHQEVSIFAAAYRLGVPITVHKGIGCDITDQHCSANFTAIGKTSGKDFLVFTKTVAELEGGVFLNLGLSTIGPEVYLKALSMARNVAAQKEQEIKHFTTAVFDIQPLGNWREEGIVDYKKPGAMSDPRYYFRPLKSILIRTVKDGGESFYIDGDFQTTVPALYNAIKSKLKG